jgi:hypothetical protein
MTPSNPKPRAEVWRPFVAGAARPCARCGIPIIFGANRLPLDLTTLGKHTEADGSVSFVARSHFETCPSAAAFARKPRPEAAP